MSNCIKFEIVEHPDSSLYRFSAAALDYLEPHFHHDFELLLPIAGKGSIIATNKSTSVSVGDLCVFNPGEVHEISSNGELLSYLCLQISPQYFKNLIGRPDRLLFDETLLRDSIPAEQVEFLNALLIEFGYQLFSKRTNGKALYSSLLNMFIYVLLTHSPYRMLSESEFLQVKTRNARIIRAVNFIENNYQRKIMLSDLARVEDLSVGYLSSFFRENFNQTFQEYVNAVRFSHAKSLIRTDKRIIDISYESGFSDPRYLTKAFLKYESCTPSEYRKRYIKQSARDMALGTGGLLSGRPLDPDTLIGILKTLRVPIGDRIQDSFDADLY